MSTYFLMVPNYYAHGPSATACWQNLRRISGRTKQQVRKSTYFMLEFAEDGLKFDVNEVTGAWHVDAYPVRVVEHNKMEARTLKQFAAWCKTGLERWAASKKSEFNADQLVIGQCAECCEINSHAQACSKRKK